MRPVASSRARSFLIGTAGLAAVLALLPHSSSAQLDTQVRDDARSAVGAQRFKEAVEGYRQHLRRDPEDAESWYFLAYSLHRTLRFKEAIPAYRQALRRKYRVFVANYNIACALARDGQTEAALDALEAALDSGYNVSSQYRNDQDLISLRGHERFNGILARASDPAGHYPKARSMRTLVGVWNATSDSGLAGRAEASLASNRFAVRFSLVAADSRVISLMLYYSTSEDGWFVIGRDEGGGAYDGPLSLSAGEMVAQGKRATDSGMERVRMVFSWQGDDSAVLRMEAMTDGEWGPESSYSLSKAS
ncbi:MAG: tetratricopeptide repeat protein [Armatimonadetes bacterium]|nr:tetratricopeptide repeat protein [Armatimonadota bacterium]